MTDDLLDRERLAAARLKATDSHPFLAEALYALLPIAQPGLGTFAVDKHWRLFIDPAKLASWTVPEVAGVLLHEVSHVIRQHGDRALAQGVSTEDQSRRWNYAADAEINDDLRRDKVVLPRNGVTPKTLGLPVGRTAEYYYEHIRERAETFRDLGCGEGAHGLDHGLGDDELPPGLTAIEILLVARRVAEKILEHQRMARVVSESWVRWAEATMRPQLDWRRLVRARVRGAVASTRGASDYSYARPSRRRIPGVVLPSIHRPLPSVAIVVDTSASVDEGRLGAAWAEVVGCTRHLGVHRNQLHVLATDTTATLLHGFPGTSVPLPGGGATDMRIGIAAALRIRPRPHVIVVLTDGETPWPDTPTAVSLILVVMPHGDEPMVEPPPWARTIVIPASEFTP